MECQCTCGHMFEGTCGGGCVAAAAVTATPRSTSLKGSSCGTVSAGFGTLCLPHTGVGSWRLPVPHVCLDTSSTRDKCVAAGEGLDAVLCVCAERGARERGTMPATDPTRQQTHTSLAGQAMASWRISCGRACRRPGRAVVTCDGVKS